MAAAGTGAAAFTGDATYDAAASIGIGVLLAGKKGISKESVVAHAT
jgi:hypothetical protein